MSNATDERIDTREMANELREVAGYLDGIHGRHRVRTDGESFEGIVDAIAKAHLSTDSVVEKIKGIGRQLFQYVERGINPTTGKKVGTIHLTGNEWDIALKFIGGGVTKPSEVVKLTEVSDENKEAAIMELVKVAVASGCFSQVFGRVSVGKVDVSTLPVEMSKALTDYGYKVELVGGGVPVPEQESYQTPTPLNKSGRGKSGKQLATQKTGVAASGTAATDEREEAKQG